MAEKVSKQGIFAPCPVCHVPCRLLEAGCAELPSVGDFSVCGTCGSASIFERDTKRAMSDDDFARLDPATRAALERHVARWTPGNTTRQ